MTGVDYFDAAGAETALSAPMHARLKRAAQAAAQTLGLEVWGGDAIMDPQGANFKIVDFNDWPSFERVRTVAAKAIARRALELLAGFEK